MLTRKIWLLLTLRHFCNISENKRYLENCTFLGYYAAGSGKSLPTLRDNILVPFSRVKNSGFLTLENGTDRLSRNVGKELLLPAA